ncbi:MAG: hypothetical protein V4519_02975 [Patescibacteria group bacterium]
MLKLHRKQHIRFATIEQPTQFVVVAVMLETVGTETVAISEPKIVKIIPKAIHLLSGSKTSPQAVLALTAPALALISQPIVSPYFAHIFGSEKSNFITGLAAQPPTYR